MQLIGSINVLGIDFENKNILQKEEDL